MTQPETTQRRTKIDSIDMDLRVALDYPYDNLDEAIETDDERVVAIVQCAEAVAFYTEELHAPSRFREFLTDEECAQVAAFIGSLGPNAERVGQWFEPRHGYITRGWRKAEVGWNSELAREALRMADELAVDGSLSENISDCVEILRAFLAYLDKLHGVHGFQEILTPDERALVGRFATDLLEAGTA
jgi:hypothetical protein